MRAVARALVLLVLPLAAAALGVSEFGPLKVGERAPFGPGDPTAYPYKVTPKSAFYVFVVAKGLPTMCVYEECSEHGALVRRLGGWITGDAQAESAAIVGLTETGVQNGTESIVVLADRKSRVIGIFPEAGPSDVKKILQTYSGILKVRQDGRW